MGNSVRGKQKKNPWRNPGSDDLFETDNIRRNGISLSWKDKIWALDLRYNGVEVLDLELFSALV